MRYKSVKGHFNQKAQRNNQKHSVLEKAVNRLILPEFTIPLGRYQETKIEKHTEA